MKLETSMVNQSICKYSDAYILVKEIIAVAVTSSATTAKKNSIIKVIFKNCPPFLDCINDINITQIYIAKDLKVVIPMHNLIEYSNNCSKSSRSFGNICEINLLCLIMVKLLISLVMVLVIYLITNPIGKNSTENV